MAISFVNVGTEAASSAQTWEVSPPASTQDNDFYVLTTLISVDFTDEITMAGETGWTREWMLKESGGGGTLLSVHYKMITNKAGEPSTYTIDIDGGVDRSARHRMFAFRGVDTSTPLDVTSTTNESVVNSATHDPAQVTGLTAGAWVLSFLGGSQITTRDGTEPSGYTLRGEQLSDLTDWYNGLASKHIPAGGTEDPGNWTNLTSTGDHSSITMALRPAGGIIVPTFYHLRNNTGSGL